MKHKQNQSILFIISWLILTGISCNSQPDLSEKKIRETKPKRDFFAVVKNYFDKTNIKILNQEIIRKNSEFDFLIEIPSAVGNLTYFCKAKAKAKINDSDLAATFAKGQIKKLPILFLTPGDLTKKAKESFIQTLSDVMMQR